jgi:hypothetical protein
MDEDVFELEVINVVVQKSDGVDFCLPAMRVRCWA